FAVINADDPSVLDLARQVRATKLPFGREKAIDSGTTVKSVEGRSWIVRTSDFGEYGLVPIDAIHLLGPHFVYDVMAATSVGSIVRANPDDMTRAVETFRGLEHAMELVADIGGVRFVNDSKATNVESALRSIESFDTGLVPIMGGRFKGGDLALLRAPLASRATALVAIGEARPLLRDALSGAVPIHEAAALDEAV